MTNYPFQSKDQFRDIESIHAYEDWVESGKVKREEFWPCLINKSRDNARTPVQWDDTENAGFTTGTPWIDVNPNYKTVNAKYEVNDPDSVFSYYQQLIALRKTYPIIVYGKYDLILSDDENIFAYTRTLDDRQLLVVCNYTKKNCKLRVPKEYEGADCLISNYNRDNYRGMLELNPYEAFVLFRK